MINLFTKTKLSLLLLSFFTTQNFYGADEFATFKIDSSEKHQRITGFGGFVCSPQFGYGHMTESEIKMVWGQTSTLKCNIMRIFISDNENSWGNAISTAKLAKELGLTVFASPWSMPGKWKTNNSTQGVTSEGEIGFLKEENYKDYAEFLNRFVLLMRENGVELDAISIQNEPDYDVSYSGCHWHPEHIANFLKGYSHLIDCKIMAPETVGLSSTSYVNALSADDVIDKFDIYAGHQYGGVGTSHKIFAEKGKEIWQSEFLINWNSESSIPERNFDWSIDAFDFAKSINDCMISEVNAWVHYATRRYYGMIGDGFYGTESGTLTKRGYILGHFSKFVTGSTRIGAIMKDDSEELYGSSFLSATGDSIIAVIVNPTDETRTLTVDLPFYTTEGKSIFTTKSINMRESRITLSEKSCRPKVTIRPSSVTTVLFKKLESREISEMKSEPVNFEKIEDQKVTSSSFGTAYKLSGKSVNFKNGSPLISNNTSNKGSYLKLTERFNKMVFDVKTLSSSYLYSSANTTLYYINNNGEINSYNYGDIQFEKRENFKLILDISPETLTDGCQGILSITNGNWSSELTFALNDVYFLIDNEKSFRFYEKYSDSDSNLLDCLENNSYTSLDFTEAEGLSGNENWNNIAENKNCIFYVSEQSDNKNPNVVNGSRCNQLTLIDNGGNLYFKNEFTAENASFECNLEGYRLLSLPFSYQIPDGIKAYSLELKNESFETTEIKEKTVEAHNPVLIYGTGKYIITGSGNVSVATENTENGFNGIYVKNYLPSDCYYLSVSGNTVSMKKNSSNTGISINPFDAYYTPKQNFTVESLPINIDNMDLAIENTSINAEVTREEIYNVSGIKIHTTKDQLKGIYIIRKYMSDGSVINEKALF